MKFPETDNKWYMWNERKPMYNEMSEILNEEI